MLKLDINRLSQEKRQVLEMSPTTIHLFAFNHDRKELNMNKLCAMSNDTNPVAIIKARVVQYSTDKKENIQQSLGTSKIITYQELQLYVADVKSL